MTSVEAMKRALYRVDEYFAFPWTTDMEEDPLSCLDLTNNLTGTSTDGIVNQDGTLTAAYESYESTHGFQSYQHYDGGIQRQMGRKFKQENRQPPSQMGVNQRLKLTPFSVQF